MTIEFSTREFEFAHGHRPRGVGRWAFFFGFASRNVEDAFWFDGLYGDAKKAARDEAKKRDAQIVVVGS
jgi:hypothetical protein